MIKQLIAHRRNTLEELRNTPHLYGIEMDIRSIGSRLVVNHEPFTDAVPLELWLQSFKHKTLILNIKEEGIEYAVKELVEKYHITNYFFLDLSFPYLIKMVNTGERRVAVRFSEYESIENALLLAGKVEWVWVDCFTQLPLNQKTYDLLKPHFKLCLVSPELQGRSVEEIAENKKQVESFEIDAVCTKRPELWQSI